MNEKKDFQINSTTKLGVGDELDVTFNPVQGTPGGVVEWKCRVIKRWRNADTGEWGYRLKFLKEKTK